MLPIQGIRQAFDVEIRSEFFDVVLRVGGRREGRNGQEYEKEYCRDDFAHGKK
jgi:hypothetical protein